MPPIQKFIEEVHAVHYCDRCGERTKAPRNCSICEAEVGLCCIRCVNAGTTREPCSVLLCICVACVEATDSEGTAYRDRLRLAVADANAAIAGEIAAWGGKQTR